MRARISPRRWLTSTLAASSSNAVTTAGSSSSRTAVASSLASVPSGQPEMGVGDRAGKQLPIVTQHAVDRARRLRCEVVCAVGVCAPQHEVRHELRIAYSERERRWPGVLRREQRGSLQTQALHHGAEVLDLSANAEVELSGALGEARATQVVADPWRRSPSASYQLRQAETRHAASIVSHGPAAARAGAGLLRGCTAQ